TLFLKALGYSPQEILDYFYERETFILKDGNRFLKITPYHLLLGQKAPADIVDDKTEEVLVKKHKKITHAVIKRMEALNITAIPVEEEDVIGKITAREIRDPETGKVLLPLNKEITKEDIELLRSRRVEGFEVLFIDNLNVSPSLRNTLLEDKAQTKEEALLEIYRKLRP
ncbi:MAG: DNA-directed RNA polymerase subunit beta, partial [Deltaproteobacteria bacterium]|nr:DNA-directed RNA polymerase subunit beta [Deltaproteobacteria bacterium]